MSVQLPPPPRTRRPTAASPSCMQDHAATPGRKAGVRMRAAPEPGQSAGLPATPFAGAGGGLPRAGLRVEDVPAPTECARPVASRIDADIAQLNLSFLHVARELSRSARELAVTRLGLDAAACAALDSLSVADLQALAHSHALIFGLRVDPSHLPMQAELARTDRIASGARLLLAADAG